MSNVLLAHLCFDLAVTSDIEHVEGGVDELDGGGEEGEQEANVSYDLLVEPDDVNPIMDTVDVCVVIGANDVVNPDARENEGSPIYGMPVIEVDRAKTVFILKRSMASGFAGIDNPLFLKENSRMLFGDAKESISTLVSEFKS